MSLLFDHQRNHLNDFIQAWLEDQLEQGQFELPSALPSFMYSVMSDTQVQPLATGPLDRPGSPSERQKNFRDKFELTMD